MKHPYVNLDYNLFQENDASHIPTTSDTFFGKNIEKGKDTDIYNDDGNCSKQQYKPLKLRKSDFKRKKNDLIASIKVLNEKFYNIPENTAHSLDVIDELTLGVQELNEIVTNFLNQNNDLLVERPTKKRRLNVEIKTERPDAASLKDIKAKHPYAGRVGKTAEMMRQFYRARMTLESMEKTGKGNRLMNREIDEIHEIEVETSSTEIPPSNPNTHIPPNNNSLENSTKDDSDVIYSKTVTFPKLSPRRRVSHAILTTDIEREINTNMRLTHATINSSQKILHEQFNIDGLEDTGLKFNQFSRNPGPFIQIFHLKGIEHWITAARSSYNEVTIFDSLSSYNKKLPKDILKSIAQICYCQEESLYITHASVQQQRNSLDCGLFAIAFAVDLAVENPPSIARYDTSKMRDHLLTCLQLKEFTPFPRCEKRASTSRPYTLSFNVFCICRGMYFEGDGEDPKHFMAMCSNCLEWFHRGCMNIPKKVFLSEKFHEEWKCQKCSS